jgi:hypothetical protein
MMEQWNDGIMGTAKRIGIMERWNVGIMGKKHSSQC